MKKRILLFFILIMFFTFSPFCNANAWGEAIQAARYKQTMEEISKLVHGVIMGALKQAAVQMINDTVNSIISGGGSGGGAMFITNWENYLYNDPRKKTDLIMNDIFTVMYSGKGSSLNYQATGSEGVTGNYNSYLAQAARNSTIGATLPRSDIQNYISDPRQLSSYGGSQFWRGYDALYSNPANNYFGSVAIGNLVYQSELEKQQKVAEGQSNAYNGYLAQKKGEQVIAPGSFIAATQFNTQDLGNKILASAQSVPEVIVAIVTKITTSAIRQGIGNARANAQREINNTISNVRSNVNSQIRSSGPGTVFKPNY